MKNILTKFTVMILLATGLAMSYAIVINELMVYWQMQEWVEVSASVDYVGSSTNNSGDKTRFGIKANYHFQYDGQQYKGNRVALSSARANFDSTYSDFGEYLSTSIRNQMPIQIFVDPKNPNDSIIVRDISWGLMILKFLLVLIFTKIGFTLLTKKQQTASQPTYAPTIQADVCEPSPQNAGVIQVQQSSNAISSNAFGRIFQRWFVGLLFTGLLSIILDNVLSAATNQLDYLFAIFIFGVISLLLLSFAMKETWLLIKYGHSPLTLDPSPSSLGGDVGGFIEFNVAYSLNPNIVVTLSHYRRYEVGYGKHRKNKEELIWETAQNAIISQTEQGCVAKFLIHAPAYLTASEPRSRDYKVWQLSVEVDIPGPDISRQYDILVSAGIRTAQTLQHSDFTDRNIVLS